MGLSLTMAVMGVITSAIGSLLTDYEVINYIAAFISLLMGLTLLGIISIDLPGFKGTERDYKGFLGAFLLGIPFAIVASPCTMPITATLLTYTAVKGNLLFGAIFMFLYSIGRSIPLLLAGTFTGFLKRIQKFESLSVKIQKLSGVILLLLGFYLWWNAI
jgi:cytochrome c biogenesis protein CcdA